jgi:LL-diaminopimelate aminotransferase
MQPAARILEALPYPFAALNRAAAEMRARGRSVISLGIGDPDTPPPARAYEALRAVIDMPGGHRYPEYAGSDRFRAAVSGYYRRRYGVAPDPATEVVGLIGSKEGLAHLLWALVGPGDVVLVPDPAYPVYAAQSRFAGAEPYPLPLRAERDFLPDLEAVPADVLGRAKVLVLCYPNAPTAAVADAAFFTAALAFGRRHGLVVVNDGAYLDIVFEGAPAPSLLSLAGPDDLAVEFFSLSKTFHMTGWRLAAAVGSAPVLDALRTMKENTDSGQWTPLQEAGAALLEDPSLDAYVASENARLRARRDRMLPAVEAVGLTALPSHATLYLWCAVPGPEGRGDRFAQRLLEQTGVLVTPGGAFGDAGAGYVRIALSLADDQVDEAARRLAAFQAEP